MTSQPSLLARLAAVALALALAGCGSSESWLARSRSHFNTGNFYQAYYSLQKARSEGESKYEVEKLERVYRTAFLMQRARNHIFDNDDLLALEDLSKVLAIDPDYGAALALQQKARSKLAREAVVRGKAALEAGDLETSLVEYHQALTYQPGQADAEAGIVEVAAEWTRLRNKAQSRYLEGVRALADQLFAQTQYQMLIALEADPTFGAAESSKAEASMAIAERNMVRAREMEQRGFWSGALREYTRISERHPELEGLTERLAVAEREVEAAAIGRKGEMAMFRGDYAKARALINEAFEKSVEARSIYNDLLIQLREREFDERYVAARDHELQGRYAEAVTVFAEIEEGFSGFRDVKARLDNLRATVELAEEYYATGVAAEAAGELAAAKQAFEDAALHYPEYKDLQERLRRVKANLQR